MAENTFARVPVAQAWQDLALWESFLDAHSFGSIVELGTFRGGFALFLALQCRLRGAKFLTIDHQDICQSTEVIETLGGTLVLLDLLEEDAATRLEELIAPLPRPLVLFCDNGNKPLEVRRFRPLLRAGDFLAVHDWDNEIRQADIPAELIPVHLGECESVQSLTRYFVVP